MKPFLVDCYRIVTGLIVAYLHLLINGNVVENLKIAVALRAARAAVGWSQIEFAEKMNVAKSTIARIETLEMTAKADFLNRALRIFREQGVVVDLLQEDRVVMSVELKGLHEAKARLDNEALRRTDRKATKASVMVVAGPTMTEVKSKRHQ